MAFTLLLGTGFGMNDIPLATLETGVTGSVDIEATETHTSPYSVKVVSDSNFCYASWKEFENKRSIAFSVWAYIDDGFRIAFGRDNSSSYTYSLRYNSSSGCMDLYVGSSTLIASGKEVVTSNGWNLIECVAFLGNEPYAPGTKNFVSIRSRIGKKFDIYYNVLEDRASALCDSNAFLQIGSTDQTVYFDDLSIGHGGAYSGGNIHSAYFAGDVRYTALAVDAETSTIEWDPSTGDDNSNLIDEVPFSESDYNSTTVDEEDDLFTFDDLDGTLRDIKWLGAWYQAWGDGSVEGLYALVKSNNDTNTQNLGTPGSSAVYIFQFFTADPDSTAAGGVWTNTSINAAQIGYRSNLSSGTIYVGGLLVEVGWTPQQVSTYDKAGGFHVTMDLPAVEDGKWIGVRSDVAVDLDANDTGSVVGFYRDGSDLFVQLMRYPGYTVVRKIDLDVDASLVHTVEVLYHEQFITVYIDSRWAVTFYVDAPAYSTENTIYLMSDPTYSGSVNVSNVVKEELYAWREGVYVEMETSGLSAIQAALQGRPVNVIANANGELEFSYGETRDSLNTAKPRISSVTEGESDQAASDAIVYADEVYAIPNAQYDSDVGWQTRVFRMFELGADARYAAQIANRIAIEQQEIHTIVIRPDVRIQINDEVTYSDTVASHALESVGETFIAQAINAQLEDGMARMTVTGRKKVFS